MPRSDAHLIVSHDHQPTAVQDGDLLAQHPADNKQRFDQSCQVGDALDQLYNTRRPRLCLECLVLTPNRTRKPFETFSGPFRSQRLQWLTRGRRIDLNPY